MIQVSVTEAKAKFCKLLDRALAGELVQVCRHNKPLIEFKVIAPERRRKRKLGTLKGRIEILPSFFEPMDEEWLKMVNGESDDPSDPLNWKPPS